MGVGKRVAFYLRVSTNGQTVDSQREELRAAAERNGWQRAAEFVDHGVSGSKGRDRRPALDKMLKAVARREFDIIAAWSVDRLGRSLQDLVATLGELHAKHVDLYLHQQGLDTGTPAGKAMFQVAGVFAEFERAMIVERVKAGMARAKRVGTKTGRSIGRPRIGAEKEERVRRLLQRQIGIVKAAQMVGVGTSVAQRIASGLARS